MGPGSLGRRGWVATGSVIYLSFVAALTGCESSTPPLKSGKPLPPGALVVVIGPSQIHPNWKGIRGGVERYAAGREFVDCLALAPAVDEPAALAAIVDGVIAKRPVAICLCVERPDAAGAVANRITGQGILLVSVGRRVPGSSTYGHVEVGWPQAAEILGRNLAALLPEAVDQFGRKRAERSYVLVHEEGRDELASQCYARFSVAARSVPALALLQERNAAQLGCRQQQLIEEMLAQFPSAEVVVTLNPEVWLCRQPRFTLPERAGAGGKSEHANRFATLGASPRLWPRLQSGEAVALVGPLDGEIGYAAVDLAIQGVMLIPDALRRRVIDCELVTAQTLADFARRYAEAANLDVADLIPFGRISPPESETGGG